MSNIDDNVVPVLYALMALEQDVTTSELAVGAQNRSMPEADTETPEWFVAATESVDLLAMAPELREMPEDSSDAEGLDIIGVYAPEMSKVRQARPAHVEPEVVDVAESVDVDKADAAVDLEATPPPEPTPEPEPVAEVETVPEPVPAPEPAPVPEPEPVAADVAPPPAPEPAHEIVEEVEVVEEEDVVEELAAAQEAAMEHIVHLHDSKWDEDRRRAHVLLEDGRIGVRLRERQIVPHEGRRRCLAHRRVVAR